MIITSILSGEGKSGMGPIAYLMGQKDSSKRIRDIKPVVLSGDLDLTRLALPLAYSTTPYLSTAMGFTEPYDYLVGEDRIYRLLAKYDELLYAGIGSEALARAHVGHFSFPDTEDPSEQCSDVHTLSVNLDLRTGRHHKGLFAAGELNLLRTFQSWTNVSFNFVAPEERRPRAFRIPKRRLARNAVAWLLKIREEIEARIEGGKTRSRADALAIFASHGWTVSAMDDLAVSFCTAKSLKRDKPLLLAGPILTAKFDPKVYLAPIPLFDRSPARRRELESLLDRAIKQKAARTSYAGSVRTRQVLRISERIYDRTIPHEQITSRIEAIQAEVGAAALIDPALAAFETHLRFTLEEELRRLGETVEAVGRIGIEDPEPEIQYLETVGFIEGALGRIGSIAATAARVAKGVEGIRRSLAEAFGLMRRVAGSIEAARPRLLSQVRRQRADRKLRAFLDLRAKGKAR